MDPNATLILLRDALAAAMDEHHQGTALQDACEHAENLIGWLDRGGFLPDAWQPFAAANTTDVHHQVDSLPAGPNLRDCLTALADAIDNDDDPPAGTAAMLRTFAHAVGNLEQQRRHAADLARDLEQLRADLGGATNTITQMARNLEDARRETRGLEATNTRHISAMIVARHEAENHAAAAQEWERIARHYSDHLAAIHDTLEAARSEKIR